MPRCLQQRRTVRAPRGAFARLNSPCASSGCPQIKLRFAARTTTAYIGLVAKRMMASDDAPGTTMCLGTGITGCAVPASEAASGLSTLSKRTIVHQNAAADRWAGLQACIDASITISGIELTVAFVSDNCRRFAAGLLAYIAVGPSRLWTPIEIEQDYSHSWVRRGARALAGLTVVEARRNETPEAHAEPITTSAFFTILCTSVPSPQMERLKLTNSA